MMNRKSFIGAVATLSGGLLIPTQQESGKHGSKAIKIPPYLKPGSCVGITAPAGFILLDQIASARRVLESWGYKIRIGATIGKRENTFGGSDAERAADLQSMLDDPEIHAIMCARGGYGVVRIIDRLNWKGLEKSPKWLIGFSDITVLHSHIHQHCGIASIHSKMTNSFPDDWSVAEPVQLETINSIFHALSGRKMEYGVIANARNKEGMGEGPLVGGNLKLLESLSGTHSDLDTRGKILFVEDTGEYLYSIDRMFWNLKRTGKLEELKGLIIGGFKIKPDDEGEAFGKTLEDIVLEKVHGYHYPVCFDFPVGHQRANFALKCGVKHRLQITTEKVNLTEIV